MSEGMSEETGGETNEHFKRWGAVLWLWAGLLAGPLAVALAQQVAYLLVTLDCSYGQDLTVSPLMLIALLLAGGGVFVSWRNWRRAGGGWSASGGDAASRSRFLAVVGMLWGGLSLLVIVALWLPVFFYRQCQR
jgi:hypothetical protein